ncbi:hypothetical protein CDL15_Pgr014379 [Punica granatum]|uniref:Uncharacterized protein n=1 Tax=Punica granatum TaxID=22663 RepID=A0A218WDF2_PUNGR|nr:hypothetical protein CDL15_Pgr014379 [Punica granatum]
MNFNDAAANIYFHQQPRCDPDDRLPSDPQQHIRSVLEQVQDDRKQEKGQGLHKHVDEQASAAEVPCLQHLRVLCGMWDTGVAWEQRLGLSEHVNRRDQSLLHRRILGVGKMGDEGRRNHQVSQIFRGTFFGRLISP